MKMDTLKNRATGISLNFIDSPKSETFLTNKKATSIFRTRRRFLNKSE